MFKRSYEKPGEAAMENAKEIVAFLVKKELSYNQANEALEAAQNLLGELSLVKNS